MIIGQKHILKCRCVLQQFKKMQEPPAHQFVVFSIVKDDVVIQKQAQCNNCGLVHKVIDICRSEIIQGKEGGAALLTIDDIKTSLHPNICTVLENNNCDLATWEAVQFNIENKLWGNIVVISKETQGEETSGKYIRVLGESLCKVETFTRTELI